MRLPRQSIGDDDSERQSDRQLFRTIPGDNGLAARKQLIDNDRGNAWGGALEGFETSDLSDSHWLGDRSGGPRICYQLDWPSRGKCRQLCRYALSLPSNCHLS